MRESIPLIFYRPSVPTNILLQLFCCYSKLPLDTGVQMCKTSLEKLKYNTAKIILLLKKKHV